jgi:hypothetical protein
MLFLKGLTLRIQRLIQQPTVITISFIILVVVRVITMLSSLVLVDTHSNGQEDYNHQTPYPSNWFSIMNSSILSNLSLFQSPRGDDFTKRRLVEDDLCHHHYDWSQSTEYNYRSKIREYHGTFRFIRQRLDHSYHQNYVAERQQVQDSIMEELFSRETKIVDVETGRECNQAIEPWIIFTAGVYGTYSCHCIKISLVATPPLCINIYILVYFRMCVLTWTLNSFSFSSIRSWQDSYHQKAT